MTIDDQIGAQAVALFEAIRSEKDPEAPSDYSNQKFWESVEFDLELLVWAVVNDGVITGDEIRLLMAVLEANGVPDNAHTRSMLRVFLEKEMEQYLSEYKQLSPEEKQRRLEEEEEIKEEINRQLKQMQENRFKQANKNSAVENSLSSVRKQALSNTIEGLVQQMGFDTQREKETSFVARFNAEKFAAKQAEFLSR